MSIMDTSRDTSRNIRLTPEIPASGCVPVADVGHNCTSAGLSQQWQDQMLDTPPTWNHADDKVSLRSCDKFLTQDNLTFKEYPIAFEPHLVHFDTTPNCDTGSQHHSEQSKVMPVFGYTDYLHLSGRRSENSASHHGFGSLVNQHYSLQVLPFSIHDPSLLYYCSDACCAFSGSPPGSLSSIDSQELGQHIPYVSPIHSFSIINTSFDNMTDHSCDSAVHIGSPQCSTNAGSPTNLPYFQLAGPDFDSASPPTKEKKWELVGDGRSEINRAHSVIPLTPSTNITDASIMHQGLLYSLPSETVRKMNDENPHSLAQCLEMPADLRFMMGNMEPMRDQTIQYLPTQERPSACMPVASHATCIPYTMQGYGRIDASYYTPQAHARLYSGPTPPHILPSSPSPHACFQGQRLPQEDAGQPFTALSSATALDHRQDTGFTPLSVFPRSLNLAEKDMFLLQSRRLGKTYGQIRAEGKYEEAESTLRGRFRSLTKAKNARVRKPGWKSEDIRLLNAAVAKLTSSDRNIAKSGRKRSLISWKEVAEHIVKNGGSYRFGNATCKKKWYELHSR